MTTDELPMLRAMSAGASAVRQSQRLQRRTSPLQWTYVTGLAVTFGAALTGHATTALVVGGASLVVMLVGTPILKAQRNWSKGAAGELRVGKLLDDHASRPNIGPNQVNVTLHDVALDGWRGNIDHLFIGMQGVFIVNAKAYSRNRRFTWRRKQLFCGSHPVDVKVDKAMAAQLGKQLGVWVSVVWCVTGPAIPGECITFDGVRITDPSGLEKILSHTTLVHRTQEVAALRAKAEAVLHAA